MLKTGGIFDVYAALNQALPDGVNNATTFDLQTMLKAHAAIKYGWDFNKWGLDLRANVTLPVIGLITKTLSIARSSSSVGFFQGIGFFQFK